jgi:hypothetical protein
LLAWNDPAAALMEDFAALTPGDRNLSVPPLTAASAARERNRSGLLTKADGIRLLRHER